MPNQHRTVWKYTIAVQDDPVRLELPLNAEILDVVAGDRADELHVWALVEPAARPEFRTFIVRGTGHPVPAGVAHRGTAHWVRQDWPDRVTNLVWHLFEVTA